MENLWTSETDNDILISALSAIAQAESESTGEAIPASILGETDEHGVRLHEIEAIKHDECEQYLAKPEEGLLPEELRKEKGIE